MFELFADIIMDFHLIYRMMKILALIFFLVLQVCWVTVLADQSSGGQDEIENILTEIVDSR